MGQDPGEVGAQQLGDESQKSPEQLRAEIQETREDLGDTVEALAAKTDVKARARERADEMKRAALLKKEELRSKVKPSSSAGDSGAAVGEPAVLPAGGASASGGGSAVPQLKGIVQKNPVPTAAVAAFIGGVAFGRLISRP
jgi:hypothetical protein